MGDEADSMRDAEMIGQGREDFAKPKPFKQSKRSGGYSSRSDTNHALTRAKAGATNRHKRRPPTLPTMPWEDAE